MMVDDCFCPCSKLFLLAVARILTSEAQNVSAIFCANRPAAAHDCKHKSLPVMWRFFKVRVPLWPQGYKGEHWVYFRDHFQNLLC